MSSDLRVASASKQMYTCLYFRSGVRSASFKLVPKSATPVDTCETAQALAASSTSIAVSWSPQVNSFDELPYLYHLGKTLLLKLLQVCRAERADSYCVLNIAWIVNGCELARSAQRDDR